METVRFRRWEVDTDPDATRLAYADTELGWAEYCGCRHCKNFRAAREQAYPAEMRTLLDRLGIDAEKELEVLPYRRIDGKTYFYTGWFHFIGSIRSGPDYWKPTTDGGLVNDPEGTDFLTEDFRMGFTARLTRISRAFRDRPIVQLEFGAKVPWVIAKRMPDRE